MSPLRQIPPTEEHPFDGQFRWPIPTYSDDRVSRAVNRTLYRHTRGRRRFIFIDKRSRDHQPSTISLDLGQEATLHCLRLTHPELLSIQLVLTEHLRSMAWWLKDCLANGFLIYILLQLITSRSGWTVLRSAVGGWMARMNLHGRGTINLSVLMGASTRSKEAGMAKEQLRRQILLVLCCRNYISSKRSECRSHLYSAVGA